jgi:hypothetical protein
MITGCTRQNASKFSKITLFPTINISTNIVGKMNKLTFKQYLDTKQQLVNAIAENPIQQSTYTVTKYCKLTVEDENDKRVVSLKPNQMIIVEWQYEDINDNCPTPLAIRFHDVDTVDESVDFDTSWTSEHIIRWLNKNTCEI